MTSGTPRRDAWFKHGPYSDSEKVVCVMDDTGNDICYSQLVFLSAYEELKQEPARRQQGEAMTSDTELVHASFVRDTTNEIIRLKAELAAANARAEKNERDAAVYRTSAIVGWLDGHNFIGLPEDAKKYPNARPVYRMDAAIAASKEGDK